MSLFRLLALLGGILLVAFACDRVEVTPNDTALNSPTETVFTTVADNELVINPNVISSLRLTQKYNVIKQPIHGVVFKKGGFLQYKNTNGIKQAEDIIEIELIKNNKVYGKETITISIVPDISYLQCNAGAVRDTFSMKKNEAQLLSILSNDHFCERPVNISLFEIPISPKHGAIKTNESYQLLYTPNTNFEGVDTFIYSVKYNNAFGSSSFTTGLVALKIGKLPTPTVKLECKHVLNPDQTTFLVENDNKKSITVNVLANDILCNVKPTPTLSIAKKPKYFDAKLEKDNTISLIPNATLYANGDNWADEITYKYGDPSATLTILPRINPDCKPIAIDDSFRFKVKDSQLKKDGNVLLNIIKNDILCGTKLTSITIPQAQDMSSKYGKLSIHGTESISFTPKNNTFKTESFEFKYTIVNDKKQTATGKVKLSFED
jgi:Bacterial Ig domain